MRATLPVKRAAASVLCSAPVGRVVGRVLGHRFRSGDCRIATDTRLVGPRTEAALFWGLYESAELRFVRQHLRRDLDVVELGASIGVVSSCIARKLEPGRRLVCVEANPGLLGLLAENLRANAPTRDVSLRHGAIAYDRPPGSDVPLALGETNVASRLAGSQGGPSTRIAQVPALTLGQVLRDECYGRYTLVSDVEGAEAEILLRDGAALRTCAQILIELHDTQVGGRQLGIADLLGLLTGEHGFVLRDRHGPVCVLERA